MDELKTKIEVRDLRNGDWYWIHKAIIKEFTQKIGATGIAVYSFLASFTDSKQSCFPSQKYIAESLGCSRATVNRSIKLLENYGLIKIKKRSRYHCVYYLLKVRCKASETQMSNRRNSDVAQMNTIDNKRTRVINNIDKKRKLKMNHSRFEEFKPKSREELLALDLAAALNDHNGLSLYISYAKKYHESFLRRVLDEVKEIPIEKIKKSRGALFNHLVKKYAQRTTKNNGN